MCSAVKASLLLLLAAPSVLLPAGGQEDCQIFYLTQPPSQLTCNPYLDTSRFSLRVGCMVAVHKSTGGSLSDFEIRWFAQLQGKPISEDPQELLLNDTTTFGVRIDQQPSETTDFLEYHSEARITGMEVITFDRFWCQITASEDIRNSTSIADLARSEEVTIAERDYYISPLLPFCSQEFFFHQTTFKCADGSDSDNGTQSEPPIVMPSSSSSQTTSATLTPTDCPPPVFREESGQTSRLVSVLLPSLMLPVIVAVLLLIAALIMTCGPSRRNLMRKQKRKRRVDEAASMENLTSRVISPPAALAAPPSGDQQQQTSAALREPGTQQAKSPPPRPPPPAKKTPIKSNNRTASPLPTVPTHSSSTTTQPRQPSNRFSQDIYEDIADSALDSYSMSNNDIYSMSHTTGREDGVRHEVDRLPHLNGPFLSSKVGRRDDSGMGHYKNAALIAISDRAAPMLVSKKMAASLPSLLDPQNYHDPGSPRKRPNEAPDSVRSYSQGQKGDVYDSLAKKKPDPTYYNQTGGAPNMEASGSLARLIEDEEPDYDEVEEEEERAASIRGRGDSTGSTRPLAYPVGGGKLLSAARKQNCISVMSESYEDMSGMEDFIESYKSAASAAPL